MEKTKKEFNQFPNQWILSPKHSKIFTHKLFENQYFMIMKTPLIPSFFGKLENSYFWTIEESIKYVKDYNKENKFKILIIHLSKEINFNFDEDLLLKDIILKHFPLNFLNLNNFTENFKNFIQENIEKNVSTYILISSTIGINKPLYSLVTYLSNGEINDIIGTISMICSLYPPGFTKNKVIDCISNYFKKNIIIDIPSHLFDWYNPIPIKNNIDKSNLYYFPFPQLTNLGSTKVGSSDKLIIKNFLNDLPLNILYSFINDIPTQNMIIWNNRSFDELNSNFYRISFQPQGIDVCICCIENNTYLIDSIGDIWNFPIKSNCDNSIIMFGILQQKKDNNFLLFLTDIIKYGKETFENENIDNRLSFLWNNIINKLSYKGSPYNLDILIRPLGSINNLSKLYYEIEKINFLNIGIIFLPLKGISSIFIPINCTIPVFATANSKNTLIISCLNQLNKLIPINIIKGDDLLYLLDKTVLNVKYNFQLMEWEIESWGSSEIPKSLSFVSDLINFFDKFIHHLNVINQIESKKKKKII